MDIRFCRNVAGGEQTQQTTGPQPLPHVLPRWRTVLLCLLLYAGGYAGFLLSICSHHNGPAWARTIGLTLLASAAGILLWEMRTGRLFDSIHNRRGR